MTFQSYGFLFLFLPLTVLLWWQLNRKGWGKGAQVWLLGVSLFFYGWHRLTCLWVLLGSILFNFLLGKALARTGQKRWLILGLVGNLGILGYFKYANFFLENLNLLFPTSFGTLQLLLPLGLSFFTFQQIAFLLDAAHGEKTDYTLLEYACFVSFFPCVASGPMAFHHEVIPQLRSASGRTLTRGELTQGLWLFSQGLWKKVIVAEAFDAGADWGFASVGQLNSTTAVLVALSYTFQLYFDFSGYTDMARGLGRMLGLNLPDNFDTPYQALTIGQFWKGWHRTMTRFFTRYVYIPLGGSRRGTAVTCRNIMIIFLLSGLWHGADWSFVLWGGLHGAAMVADRLLGKRVERLHPALSWALTFGFVTFCWVFFRAESISQGMDLCRAVGVCSFGGIDPGFTSAFLLPLPAWLTRFLSLDPQRAALGMTLVFFAFAFLFCFQERGGKEKETRVSLGGWTGVLCGLLLFWSVISLTGVTQFLYSEF
ncbi:MAG: MBOAT family O-acyltransferase [Evtepia sp.]|uniref:MBOAT family O-acyltransferase n=1 Tax=Evtepia sp. TaxID=2773933 RepID=UPI002A748469|nr:MBOAT family O-acyltransferase [Evtepia sp.]MDY3014798.1 MBOAT family O-acyltransferase [Evtepia sp.]